MANLTPVKPRPTTTNIPTRDGVAIRGPLAPAWVSKHGGHIRYDFPCDIQAMLYAGTRADCEEYLSEVYHAAMMREDQA